MKKFRNEAQQIIEYMLVFAAVIAVCVWFLYTGGPMKWSTEYMINMAIESLDADANRINSL